MPYVHAQTAEVGRLPGHKLRPPRVAVGSIVVDRELPICTSVSSEGEPSAIYVTIQVTMSWSHLPIA